MCTEEDERLGLGPMDSGSDGNFLGRAYVKKGYSDPTQLTAATVQDKTVIRFPEHEADRGMGRRVQKFKSQAYYSADATEVASDARYNGTADAGSGTIAGAAGPYRYTLVSKLPVGVFTYYQSQWH